MSIVNTRKYEFAFVIAAEGYTIAENRIFIVSQAQKQECTHILFIDDDMVFPADTLDRLLAHEVEIVGVNSHSRKLPLKSTVLFDGEELPKDLFEAITVGGGVLLVDMKVFSKIEMPWFGFKTNEVGMITMGEDAWFCEKAQYAGYKIWCDPTLSIGHIGKYQY